MERVKAAGRENERMEGGLRIGIDVGGTFTDLVAIDGTGPLRRCKVFSTPEDPSRAVLAGLEQLLGATATDAGGAESADAGRSDRLWAGASIVHGSTITTNAVLERKGARTAFVATRGFRDLLTLGRQDRPDLFDFESRRPEPLASEELCFEVSGRVDPAGVELEPLDEGDLPELIGRLRSGGAESVAICLLFSFARPEHEVSVGRALREAGFDVSLSSEVLPEFREYERASTTALNAYVGPILDRYLGRLEERLPSGTLRIMLSNGGSAGVEAARREAVRSILSGPAAGVVGALRVARAAGNERILSFDMGGTSTDVALLDGGVPFTSEGAIAGLPVRVPMVDIHTVGAGGGSIARVDAGGALRVGPESAGAVPGPVCYGRGGKQPAVTDANVVLGRLPPDRFLAGALALDAAAALAALAELGREAGLETSGLHEADLARRAALGVVRVANARMERALRKISAERGRDPEDFTLVSFGGAGGLHACDLARALGIRRVLVPPSASVLSAFGMLAADVLKDYVQTVMQPGDAPLASVEAVAAGLEKRGRSEVAADGIVPDRISLRRELDVRYEGQAFEVAVPLVPDFVGLFHAEHERLFGHSDPAAPVQVVNVRVRAIGQVEPPLLEEEAEDAEGQDPVELDRRPVVLGERPGSEASLDVREAPVLEHGALRPGHRLAGPAIVVSTDTTLYLGPSDRARVDGYRNLLIEVGTEP